MTKIKINDITLREASRSARCELSFKEIIEIAKILDRLNADVISLAPIVNEKIDSLLVRTVAAAVKKSALSIPVGYDEAGVETAWKAVCEAERPRLCVEVPLSAVQMEFICHKKPNAVMEMISALVRKCREFCPDVEFAAVDATRSERKFLYVALRTAIEAGAATVTICDSAGTMTPFEFELFIEDIRTGVPELENVTIAAKCSATLSMASACAISAVHAGVTELNVASRGMDAPELDAVASVVRMRGDDLGCSCGVKYTELNRLVCQMNRILNAERGGIMKDAGRFSDGGTEGFILDANDDISAVASAAVRLGYELSEDDVLKVYETFKLAAAKKTVGVKELEAIIATSALQVPPSYELADYVITSGNIISATANIHCRHDGRMISGLAAGNGPIDAAFLAIEQITGHHYELDDFQIQSVTEGREAMGSAIVKLRSDGKLYSGSGISTDIISASINAYFNALNKISYEESHR
ncbi:MAG: alpha-isopropylmalate synthase regulatory domain-containing protein [Synergistes sp.]|nr:alpha-isopropylmalate synthase regulatory domain-containing protein [Synergistes sp.]